jgi:hypothetical protein
LFIFSFKPQTYSLGFFYALGLVVYAGRKTRQGALTGCMYRMFRMFLKYPMFPMYHSWGALAEEHVEHLGLLIGENFTKTFFLPAEML